ncbi:hypothetical protein [Intrasporangium calvum]|uniref:hypothetical protein n=1 Tax=Intrasporangium calvum TaxID=53358 RepID=UPI00059C975F|nr:hypothetical protein [Intrasporangium calvum]AXG14874.1 hypothetical protein DN585_16980 [Intrasporangium calvum]
MSTTLTARFAAASPNVSYASDDVGGGRDVDRVGRAELERLLQPERVAPDPATEPSGIRPDRN